MNRCGQGVRGQKSLKMCWHFLWIVPIMAVVCHINLQDHMIKVLYDFYGLEDLKASHHPTKCGSYRHCDSGDIMVLVCHVMSQDHVMK